MYHVVAGGNPCTWFRIIAGSDLSLCSMYCCLVSGPLVSFRHPIWSWVWITHASWWASSTSVAIQHAWADGDYINAGMLESARGWAATNLFNRELKVQFEAYYTSPDTFLLALLGVWVAHGEGRCFWPNDAVKEEAMRQNCVALKYVDDDGNVTMEYPMNPNKLVGLTLPDGRHLWFISTWTMPKSLRKGVWSVRKDCLLQQRWDKELWFVVTRQWSSLSPLVHIDL